MMAHPRVEAARADRRNLISAVGDESEVVDVKIRPVGKRCLIDVEHQRRICDLASALLDIGPRAGEPRRDVFGITLNRHAFIACSAAAAADTCQSLILPSAAGTRTGQRNSTPVRVIAVYSTATKHSHCNSPVGVAQPATRRMRARTPLVLVACIRLRRGA